VVAGARTDVYGIGMPLNRSEVSTQSMRPRLYPAVTIDGEVRRGAVGEGHDDILYRLPGYPDTRYDSSVKRGFVTDQGVFLDRKAAFRFAEEHRLLNATVIPGEDRLESSHLKITS
jgi:hypothetical protein